MKKVERINVMMRYINNRAHFTIAEIMQEFQISRSTAIRDIREIESMGVPLVAEVGRDGGYAVMKNAVLPSVRFTDNELKALFIAFMATRNLQLPYLKSRQSLAEKLLGLISEAQQDDLVLLNKILLFEGTNPHNPDLLELSDLPHPLLEKLIQLLLLDRYLTLSVNDDDYAIYLIHLYREKNIWWVEGFDINEERKRLIPVDHLTKINVYHPEKRLSTNAILKKMATHEVKDNIVMKLGPKAIGQYKKYHPFNVSLTFTDPYQTTAIAKMYVRIKEQDQLEEIANWLLFLGQDAELMQVPKEVYSALEERFYRFQWRKKTE